MWEFIIIVFVILAAPFVALLCLFLLCGLIATRLAESQRGEE